MDKTTYLNHYYFISIISFLMIFLPAGNWFSWDSVKNPTKSFSKIPVWNVDVIKLMLLIVYLYAGIAKLNSEWLLEAMPLKIWLPPKNDIPILGFLFRYEWVIYIFSWVGAIFDLSIPFLLWFRKTRLFAFGLVVLFHLLTAVLFPIGMFPYIMIISTLIFFSSEFHKKILAFIGKYLKIQSKKTLDQNDNMQFDFTHKLRVIGFIVFFIIQLIIPFRYMFYPQNLYWSEEGYRFSWRVMLMEKAGYVQFKVVDNNDNSWFIVDNQNFLTAFQEKQMSTQPDFILEYAHFLVQQYSDNGKKNLSVYANSFVAINGRKSRQFIDPSVDLAKETESFKHKKWILPFDG